MIAVPAVTAKASCGVQHAQISGAAYNNRVDKFK
jgi:hypothetical protein